MQKEKREGGKVYENEGGRRGVWGRRSEERCMGTKEVVCERAAEHQ